MLVVYDHLKINLEGELWLGFLILSKLTWILALHHYPFPYGSNKEFSFFRILSFCTTPKGGLQHRI
jgi:hypothetical protein